MPTTDPTSTSLTSTPSPAGAIGAADCPAHGDVPLDYPFEPPSALDAPAEWAQLQRECPVARVRAANGVEGMLLTRYEDVKTMLADPRFQRGPLAGEAGGFGDTSGGDPMFAALGSIMEGEGHMRWRRLLGRTFTVKRVAAMKPGIERLAHQLVDDMTADGASADLRSAYAFPLPVFVICDLLGVPADDRDRFSEWSDRLLNLTRFSQEESLQAGMELYMYIHGLVQAKRQEPGADLLSELTTISDEDPDRLSEAELVLTGIGLLVAGHETTANMIGKMVAMLLADRSRWEALLADRSLVGSAVEECLRYDANLGFAMARHVDEEIGIADVTIPAGTTVWSVISAANRDETVFPDAARFDPRRSPNPHITFGSGAHSCLGQSLARAELQIALEVLLDRLPTLRLAVEADDLQRRDGLIVGGLEEVPVAW